MSLDSIFVDLPRPKAEGHYAVEKGERSYLVAKGFQGFPSILIRFESESGNVATPRQLANLSYRGPAEIELVDEKGKRRREPLAVLECRTTDPDLTRYFFRIVEALIGDSQALTSSSDFEQVLDSIVALFRALQQPGTRTVQGLWGELATILWSHAPELALSAWHTGPRALFDFAASGDRLEVKTSSTGVREHKFRLDQLGIQHPGHTVVVSLLVTESASGANVFDLAKLIRARGISSESTRRMETIVAETLGRDWAEGSDLRFDVDAALVQRRLYAASAVPTVPQPIPAEVRDVSFTVDLSTTDALEPSIARGYGAFFAGVLSAG